MVDKTAFGTAEYGSSFAPGQGDEYDPVKGDRQRRMLENLQNKSSAPNGAASQEGALGASASAGGNSPALGEVAKGEGGSGMDMVSIFMGAGQKERDKLTTSVTEGFAPHGVSLEGGFLDVLKKSGPQGMARAAQFGIDLEPWAAKLNPGQAETALGQQMGTIPSDENAGKAPFKTKEGALSDTRAKAKGMAKESAAKKKAQRDAIAAFLMETGLRIMASNRPTAEAFGTAALGTMDATAKRKRLAANDKMQADERTRQHGREDASDSRAVAQEGRAVDKAARDATKAAREGLEKITTKDGNVEFVRIAEGRAVGEDGEPVIVDNPSALSETAWRGAIDAAAKARTRYRTALNKAMADPYESKSNASITAIIEMPEGPEKEKAQEDWIKSKVEADGYFAAGQTSQDEVSFADL